MQYTQVKLLKYMMASAAHLMTNAVHPSEAPNVHDGIFTTLDGKCGTPSDASDVHDGICSTSVGNYSTPSEAPDLHDRTYSTLDGKCSTPK